MRTQQEANLKGKGERQLHKQHKYLKAVQSNNVFHNDRTAQFGTTSVD